MMKPEIVKENRRDCIAFEVQGGTRRIFSPPWKTSMALASLCVFTLLLPTLSPAVVELPAILSNGMVLQRDATNAIWGMANPGEVVTVKLGKAKIKAQADNKGKWQARLPPMPAGGPHELTVIGQNTVTLSDVWVGEVWLCSGQSNMQITLKSYRNHADVMADITTADFPQIRAYNPPPVGSQTSWTPCSPKTAADFSATAFYFGRYLHQELKVPIGLILRAIGSTYIENWVPFDALRQAPWGKKLIEMQKTREFSAAKAEFAERIMAWQAAKAEWARKKAEGTDRSPEPARPVIPPILAQYDRGLGNKFRIIPQIIPFTIRGVIWYQGEANVADEPQDEYLDKMKTLIGSWRNLWAQGDFPFYYVQLAPYRYAQDWTVLPRFWEVQAAALCIPGAAMAGTLDLGDAPDNVHPSNKREVGRRLALLALAKIYGREDVACSGPTYKSMAAEGCKLRIRFDNVYGGLTTRDGKPPAWFQVAGADKAFVEAQAEIKDDTVCAWSAAVEKPIAVRYAWHQTPGYQPGTNTPTGPTPNLTNVKGLPTLSFRTDSW
ncbi:MAG: sialate O-acetylesterase [Kiritimatiellae bacterium]|nr:sialate O-acetylesterase [Kiritimatiellia bacterium]